ncbi:hypothetical protein N566_12790 [Streptomycetaceae bacterium MP113-05]|nr:hypothetical protein N566_12790 [Streptomycetaceae bacterium MP113-05]
MQGDGVSAEGGLNEAARPARTPGTVPVGLSLMAFPMQTDGVGE